MSSLVRRENYLIVLGWMITDLNLKGNELLVYAIIYGFSQKENQSFEGSLQYLADWTNSTKQGVLKSLKSLEEKKLIKKEMVRYNVYKYSAMLNKVYDNAKQSLTSDAKQSLTNNIDTNNKEYRRKIYKKNFYQKRDSKRDDRNWVNYNDIKETGSLDDEIF